MNLLLGDGTAMTTPGSIPELNESIIDNLTSGGEIPGLTIGQYGPFHMDESHRESQQRRQKGGGDGANARQIRDARQKTIQESGIIEECQKYVNQWTRQGEGHKRGCDGRLPEDDWNACDLAYIINEGEIIEPGAPENFTAGEVVRLVYPEEGFKCGCDLKLF